MNPDATARTSARRPATALVDSPAGAPSTLPAAVSERLRRMIVDGELGPGTRLNERALCDQLGVSRTPLREAFRVLAADGLVQITPNRGAHVVAMSDSDIRDSFELLGALEALAGELACERIADEEAAAIKALTYRMLACHARRDRPAYQKINRAIHDRMNRAAGNRVLRDTYAMLERRIENLRFPGNLDEDQWADDAREHERMVHALEARDGRALAQILRAHVHAKAQAMLDGMRNRG